MRCAYWLCLEPVEGMTLICDKHRAARKAECASWIANPNYHPHNPNCHHGMHQQPHAYGVLIPGATHLIKHQSCIECHYCGEVHEAA